MQPKLCLFRGLILNHSIHMDYFFQWIFFINILKYQSFVGMDFQWNDRIFLCVFEDV